MLPAICRALLVGVLSLAVPGPAWCERGPEQSTAGESQVKAAFLFNIAKFVQWPKPNAGPLVIGVVDDDAFAETLANTVKGQRINAREIVTRRLAIGDDPSGCHVLYMAGLRPHDVSELLRRVRGPVLTVGESAQFLRDGGMVRLYVDTNKVRFQISQRNVEAVDLKVSSQLLTLAARN